MWAFPGKIENNTCTVTEVECSMCLCRICLKPFTSSACSLWELRPTHITSCIVVASLLRVILTKVKILWRYFRKVGRLERLQVQQSFNIIIFTFILYRLYKSLWTLTISSAVQSFSEMASVKDVFLWPKVTLNHPCCVQLMTQAQSVQISKTDGEQQQSPKWLPFVPLPLDQ